MKPSRFIFIVVLSFSVQSLVAQDRLNTNSHREINWSEEQSHKLSKEIKSYMKLTHTPGLAVAIIQNGEILKRSFYGFADVDKETPVSYKSEFWLASISKHLTTSLVLDLEENKTLSRDDLITKYIEDLPESWEGIKVKHLMSHTSGILDTHNSKDGEDFATLLSNYAPRGPNINEFIELLKNVKINHSPGENYTYSDIGMMALAVVASKAAKKPFHQLMQEHIFEPANMSSYVFNPTETNPNQVVGYTWTNGQLIEDKNRKSVLSFDQREYGGAGNLFVTLDDMINWNKALNENTILNQETKALLWDSYQLSTGEKINSGLGLNRINYPGGYSIGHNGIAGTEYWKFPEYNIDIIILSNHGMNLASFGFTALVADQLGLLDKIEPKLLLQSRGFEKAAADSSCLVSGKYKFRGPFPTDVYIDFYTKDRSPNVLVQGLNYELITLKNCTYLGYSKAIFFPGAPLPYLKVEDNTVNWMMGPNKLPLTEINE